MGGATIDVLLERAWQRSVKELGFILRLKPVCQDGKWPENGHFGATRLEEPAMEELQAWVEIHLKEGLEIHDVPGGLGAIPSHYWKYPESTVRESEEEESEGDSNLSVPSSSLFDLETSKLIGPSPFDFGVQIRSLLLESKRKCRAKMASTPDSTQPSMSVSNLPLIRGRKRRSTIGPRDESAPRKKIDISDKDGHISPVVKDFKLIAGTPSPGQTSGNSHLPRDPNLEDNDGIKELFSRLKLARQKRELRLIDEKKRVKLESCPSCSAWISEENKDQCRCMGPNVTSAGRPAVSIGFRATLIDDPSRKPVKDRKRRRTEEESDQEKPAADDAFSPSNENREVKDMYTNAPASNISKLPEPFRTAVQNGRLCKWEKGQNGLETTGCLATLFPKDNTQDVSFTIWCGNKDGYRLNDFFGLRATSS
ncbi:hypothetical protein D0Z07_9340 [Hyphodiscus hymeniophilus]|uniref:Uncharacterized protein n=1 Tax=Hyphodiscus hymeniophilus TaxID=353542 RepID=A0A9P6SMB6_9HELO|nr:hypothetical protein D0Z07_9340 [Hyphodiscus hymeniophilus]